MKEYPLNLTEEELDQLLLVTNKGKFLRFLKFFFLKKEDIIKNIRVKLYHKLLEVEALKKEEVWENEIMEMIKRM